MKQHKSRKPLDEREKLRKFRELDDAFGAALRELDGGESSSDPLATSSADTRVLDSQTRDTPAEEAHLTFERRLRDLMQDYALPEESVSDLLQTLRSLGRIA